MDRELSKMGLDGMTQRRVHGDGIDIRIDKNGINQVIIDKPKMKKPSEVSRETKLSDIVVVYSYEGKSAGAISALSHKTIAVKAGHYWGTEPATDLSGILDCSTILIVEPQRVLTTTEARVFNLLLSKGRNIFIFPGENTTVYNAVLRQLGSNLQMIPMTVADKLTTTITADTRASYRIICRRRGFLHPIADNTLTPDVIDPFGKLLSTKDVVSMTPTFYLPNSAGGTFSYKFGSELLDILNKRDPPEDDTITLTWTRTPYIGTAVYPNDWATLSLDDVDNWLCSLSNDFIGMVPYGYTFKKDDLGYLTYEERDLYDFMGSYAAYETERKLFVHGYSPYWLFDDYEPEVYDKDTDIPAFCKWMTNPANVSQGAFGSSFIPVIPFYYSCTYSGGYIPPIQW